MTVCAILSVAQFSIDKALPGVLAFEEYAKTLPAPKGNVCRELALPVLKGCIEYLSGNLEAARTILAPVAESTRPMGHSDEQRVIFPETLKHIKKLLLSLKMKH